MRTITIGFIAAILAVTPCFAAPVGPSDVEARFQKTLRNTKVTSIKEGPVKGLYEVIAGPNVFYYSPEGKGHLIFGQILDSDGNNLTADILKSVRAGYAKVQEQAAAEKLKTLPYELAIKVGSGPNIIIEFTDPDCPYCRKVDQFLSNRSDVTRYVFLNPIDQLHPSARAKSIYALDNKDQATALREIFSGKFDKIQPPIANADLPNHPAAVKQLEAGMKIGRDLGVSGTPMLFVNGQMVQGADIQKITQLLHSSK